MKVIAKVVGDNSDIIFQAHVEINPSMLILVAKEKENIANVNLFGSFEFNPSTSKVDIDALVAHYADSAHWRNVQESPLG